jgi:putative methionine-R-sulfoxide reductase with GAF domain
MSFEQVVAELDKKLLGTKDVVEKAVLISDTLKEVVGADRCTIFIYDEVTNSFWSAYIDGVSYIEIAHGEGLVSKVFSSKKASIYNDVKSVQEHFPQIDQNSGYLTKSMITAPILTFDNSALGVVQVLNKLDKTEFGQYDLEVLMHLLGHIVEFAQVWIVRKN